jgi:HEPN domain-containing protein
MHSMIGLSFDEAEVLAERARAFLRNAENLFDQGQYDISAFSLEQYCQLIVKYKLLTKAGVYPRIHSLMGLLQELSKFSSEVSSFIRNKKNVVFLTKIEDAYIGSRYLPRRYQQTEVKEMIKFVKEVFVNVIERV